MLLRSWSPLAAAAVLLLAACPQSSTNNNQTDGSTNKDGMLSTGDLAGQPAGDMASPGPGPGPTVVVPPDAVVATPTTTTLALPTAAALGEVKYVPNRSSVVVFLPAVDNTRDYRAFVVRDGVVVSTVDTTREHVAGAAIFCAGLRQRNQCDNGAVASLHFNNEEVDLPTCPSNGHAPSVPATVNRAIEINGVGTTDTLVVEAIDRQCPFAGVIGPTHADVSMDTAEMGPMVDVNVNNQAYTIQRWQASFPVRTLAEVTSAYGSVIFNGQGPNRPDFSTTPPESPLIRMAQPAPANDPVVLARAVVTVSALGTATLPAGFGDGDYFDDFADDTDQPVAKGNTGNLPSYMESDTPPTRLDRWETKKWVFYASGMAGPPGSDGLWSALAQMFVDRGVLHTILSDFYLDAMSSISFFPKRPVVLPVADNRYLHVTFEVPTIETSRRYFNLALCGSDTAGQTYANGRPLTAPIPRPAFMDDEGISRTNPLGWNCLYLVPRGPGYYEVAGGDLASAHSDTSMKVTVMPTHPAPTTTNEYDTGEPANGLALQFGPDQDSAFPRQWERAINSSKAPSGPWLDDVLDVWRRTKFDVFIRRDRLVVFVNGEQRLCTSLAARPLTMAEGALGFWQVLYHSSAEFLEMRNHQSWANPLTGSSHIINNTPFIDARAWDNVGFREDVELPADYDAGRCL